MNTDQVKAPWTPSQVANLHEFQTCGLLHEFTCCDHNTMLATTSGLCCQKCGRVQPWAYRGQLDGTLVRSQRELVDSLTKVIQL